MITLRIILLSVAILLLMHLVGLADSSGRIHGIITTVDGDVFEGLIRWDKNEGSWVDVLDGNKELPKRIRKGSKRRRYSNRDREHSIEIFGLRIDGKKNSWWSSSSRSGIRFGHIRSLEVVDDERVLLILKSGAEVELEGGSTDIGDDIRELVIEDESKGEIEFVWDDIEKVEFASTKGSLKSGFGERLYGTLTTRRGDDYTGFVCWDVDEIFETDILDGEERNRRRKLEFSNIKAIERYSSSGATVYLNNGDEMVLRETNDVDDGNRGIIIGDPGFGQVRVDWDEFKRLEFGKAPQPVTYDQFDGGRKLHGTVTTEDGDEYTGEIRWDDDEEYTWEILDGDYRGAEFDIEFGLIKSIEKKSRRTALVTVLDGRTFRLRGSNDVDEDNKGIFVSLPDGDEIEVDWEDFERVKF